MTRVKRQSNARVIRGTSYNPELRRANSFSTNLFRAERERDPTALSLLCPICDSRFPYWISSPFLYVDVRTLLMPIIFTASGCGERGFCFH